jgi:cyclase
LSRRRLYGVLEDTDRTTKEQRVSWDDGTPYVDELAAGVYAYVQPDGGWMVNNCGTVVDGSGTAVMVDTTSTEKRNRAVLAEVRR